MGAARLVITSSPHFDLTSQVCKLKQCTVTHKTYQVLKLNSEGEQERREFRWRSCCLFIIVTGMKLKTLHQKMARVIITSC